MILLDYFAVRLCFGIIILCGQKMVVPLVEFYRKSERKPSLSASIYTVRYLNCRKDHILSKKISSALTGRRNRVFWQEIKTLKRSKTAKCSQSSVVDDFTNMHIFCSKLSTILNSGC